MQALMHPWEPALISLAHEALTTGHTPSNVLVENGEALHDAYEYCDAMTSEHSKSFFMASSLLPPDKKRGARALYAFCRVTDDIVDSGNEGAFDELTTWRQHASGALPANGNPVVLAWTDARLKHGIPFRYAEQLISGVAQDLTKSRYGSFDELVGYCYGVASTVGLMSMHIIGYSSQNAIPYAIKLGVALQLTNILRDVGEDWARGRVYLPEDELRSFGLTSTDIDAGVVTDRWREFMRFQIERNRQLYAEARPGIGYLNRNGRFAIAAAADLYQAILDDIETNDYDVFNRRAHVSKVNKLARLPRTWWSAFRAEAPGQQVSSLMYTADHRGSAQG